MELGSHVPTVPAEAKEGEPARERLKFCRSGAMEPNKETYPGDSSAGSVLSRRRGDPRDKSAWAG